MSSRSRITGIGCYVPSKVLPNSVLADMVDTSDEWIVQRTGIHERRIAAEDEFTSHLCIEAVNDLIRNYDVDILDVDMILVATYTPDFQAPSVACLIQQYFHIPSAGTLDLNAACSGFVYAMNVADGLISAGLNRKILVIGADTASKITDYTDRSSCILFGDGAGALLMERTEEAGACIAHYFGTDGNGGIHLYRTGLRKEWQGEKLTGDGMLMQNGREVYRFAVGTVPGGVRKLLDQADCGVDEIDWFIPHSANLRIVESLCQKTGFPVEKTLTSMEYCGNTSAASIPLSLCLGVKAGQVKAGDRLLLFGFGGGFTYGGMIVDWTLAKRRECISAPISADAGQRRACSAVQ